MICNSAARYNFCLNLDGTENYNFLTKLWFSKCSRDKGLLVGYLMLEAELKSFGIHSGVRSLYTDIVLDILKYRKELHLLHSLHSSVLHCIYRGDVCILSFPVCKENDVDTPLDNLVHLLLLDNPIFHHIYIGLEYNRKKTFKLTCTHNVITIV